MQREVRALLSDVVKAGEAILRYTAGKSFQEYDSDEMLRDAVERRFTIVGEALKEALRQDGSVAQRITGLRDILAFRNVLVHAYATILNAAVWDKIQNHLPLLLTEVRALLDE